MTVLAPVRNSDQRMEALKRANAIRVRRARMKDDFRLRTPGMSTAEQLVEEPPSWLFTMHVKPFLESLPKMGPVKARSMMNRCRISEAKTIGGLSDRQRAELLHELKWNRPL